MSSGNSYPRCELEVGSSRRLLIYSLLLIMAAVAAPWFSALPVHVATLASALALLPARSSLRWARGELAHIAWQSEGRWTLVERDGAVHDECVLLPGIYVGANLILLRWRCIECDSRFSVALPGDNCDVEQRRRMVVRLNVTPDSELFVSQSLPESLFQLIGRLLPAKFAGTSTVSRGGCRSSRSG